MARMRVHELAAEMGLDPRVVIDEGRKHGIRVDEAGSELSTSDVFILRAFLRDVPRPERATPPPPVPSEPPAEEDPPELADEPLVDGTTPPHLRAFAREQDPEEEAPPAEEAMAPVEEEEAEGPIAPHLVRTVHKKAKALAPHVIRVALETGQVLWANVQGAQAILRSGAQVALTTRPPDGMEGWRPIRIVNSEKLLASALPIPGHSLQELEADDPAALWDMPKAGAVLPDRPESFPVGLASALMKKSVAYGWVALGVVGGLGLGFVLGSVL